MLRYSLMLISHILFDYFTEVKCDDAYDNSNFEYDCCKYVNLQNGIQQKYFEMLDKTYLELMSFQDAKTLNQNSFLKDQISRLKKYCLNPISLCILYENKVGLLNLKKENLLKVLRSGGTKEDSHLYTFTEDGFECFLYNGNILKTSEEISKKHAEKLKQIQLEKINYFYFFLDKSIDWELDVYLINFIDIFYKELKSLENCIKVYNLINTEKYKAKATMSKNFISEKKLQQYFKAYKSHFIDGHIINFEGSTDKYRNSDDSFIGKLKFYNTYKDLIIHKMLHDPINDARIDLKSIIKGNNNNEVLHFEGENFIMAHRKCDMNQNCNNDVEITSRIDIIYFDEGVKKISIKFFYKKQENVSNKKYKYSIINIINEEKVITLKDDQVSKNKTVKDIIQILRKFEIQSFLQTRVEYNWRRFMNFHYFYDSLKRKLYTHTIKSYKLSNYDSFVLIENFLKSLYFNEKLTFEPFYIQQENILPDYYSINGSFLDTRFVKFLKLYKNENINGIRIRGGGAVKKDFLLYLYRNTEINKNKMVDFIKHNKLADEKLFNYLKTVAYNKVQALCLKVLHKRLVSRSDDFVFDFLLKLENNILSENMDLKTYIENIFENIDNYDFYLLIKYTRIFYSTPNQFFGVITDLLIFLSKTILNESIDIEKLKDQMLKLITSGYDIQNYTFKNIKEFFSKKK